MGEGIGEGQKREGKTMLSIFVSEELERWCKIWKGHEEVVRLLADHGCQVAPTEEAQRQKLVRNPSGSEVGMNLSGLQVGANLSGDEGK